MANPWDSVDPPSYEVDSWNSFDGDIIVAGVALESEAAPAATSLVEMAAGEAIETDVAIAALAHQFVTAGVAQEFDDAALPISITPSPATEVDSARALSLTTVLETDVALPAIVKFVIPAGIATEANGAYGGMPPAVQAVFHKTSNGSLFIQDEEIEILPPDFSLQILDPIIERGPGVISFTVDGGVPEEAVEFYVDGTLAWETTLNSGGALAPSTIAIYAGAGGGANQGTHTLQARQVMYDGTILTSTATYEVLYNPWIKPAQTGADADPVEVPGAVRHGTRHWVLQDLYPTGSGGLGSYILPINPSTMTSPHWENTFSTRRTVAKSGQHHVFQTGRTVPEWTFSGYAPTQEMVEKLLAYRNLNRRFYLIDHRNRAWKVVFTKVDLKARLRHNFNGEITDWGHDYEVTALILDQEWWEPQ